MKVAILTPAFYQAVSEIDGEDTIIWGGSERYTLDFCHFLQSRGIAVTVFQYLNNQKDGKRIPCGQLTKYYDGIQFILLPDTQWQYNTNPMLNMRFNECVVGNYDLAIYWTTYMAYPHTVSPSIALCHGIYWDYPYSDAQAGDENYRREYMRRQIQGFKNPDIVVSVDSNTKRVIQAIQPGLENNIEVIYNYVNTDKFKPRESPRDWERLRVLYPRRLTLLRGCNEFIRASVECPDYDFLAVGQGADQQAYAQQQAWGETTKNIRFTWRPLEGMEELYQEADLAAVPTRSCEGLALSLLESMACGLPTITTIHGGLTDATIDGYNTVIFDPAKNNLSEIIKWLADNPDVREVMGKRNREIARDCFDIRIWQARWDVVLRQFGVSTAAIPGWKPKDSPKLVAMMPVKNESDRYLERVLENTLTFAEEIAILDDHSDPDQYAKLLDIQNKLGCDKIHVAQATATWDNESELRAELLRFALTRSPDWLIAVDADELYEPDMAGVVKEYMTQQSIDVVAFRFYDMWNDEYHYRDDDFSPAATVYAPRMFRVKNGTEYHFNGKLRHCGSIPQNIVDDVFLPSSIRVKHLGYMNPQDRIRKYREKTQDDPTYQYYSKEIYDAILDNDPPCVEWSDQNYWQAGAGKLVIAYPPDMEWNIMQQRPHHLLSLAASERHRVFFADDMALADTIDAEPYLTLVKNWQDCEFVKDVDVLYVTAPHQLAYCGHINYKTIVYDCVDFRGSSDEELIRTADHVLCASQMLYDRALRLGARCPVYVPNACDYAHFASTLSPQNDVVGYMGIVASVLNLDIIKELAKRWPMFMMGEIKTDVSILKGKVDIRGHVPYDALPQNLASAKVGIIPFKIGGDYEMYSAPIKVYEYLAAGRPVVATPIPELLPLAEQGLIRVAEEDDIDGWMQAVGEAMKEYPNAAGQEWAKTQTWINRWETIKAEVLNI